MAAESSMENGPRLLTMDLQPWREVPKAQTAKIEGRITYVAKSGLSFTVVTPSQGKKFQINSNTRVDAHSGDLIICYCTFTDINLPFTLIRPPLITTPCDRDNIAQMFVGIFRRQGFGSRHGYDLYDHIAKQVTDLDDLSVNNVPLYVSMITEKWFESRDNAVLDPIAIKFIDFEYQLKPYATKVGIPDHIRRARHLVLWWRETHDIRQLKLLGLDKEEILEAKLPLQALYEKILVNPYVVPAVPLAKCVEVDTRTCRQPHSTDLICGKIVRDLWTNTNKRGWSCTSRSWIMRRYPEFPQLKERLNKEFELVYDTVPTYAKPDDKEPSDKAKYAYFAHVHEAEVFVSKYLAERVQLEPYIKMGDPIFPQEGLMLDKEQQEAVNMAMHSNVSIIKGPAGSGKTTMMTQLIHNLKVNHIKYACCSFTGKAVARIKEVTSDERAATMHRMIGNLDVDLFEYLIVDESSMVSLGLLYEFLKRFTHKFMIVFIGDPNQLPPIEWGSFFNSIIQSYSVPTTTLTSNHRVLTKDGEVNGIIHNTNRIAKWRDRTMYPFDVTEDFVIENCEVTRIKDILVDYRTKGFPVQDFVIITPYTRWLPQINRIAQLLFNGKNPMIEFRGQKHPHDTRWFYVGDKVTMKNNNYEHDIMNGEEGMVVEIGDNYFSVRFGRKVVKVRDSKRNKTGTRMVYDALDSDVDTYDEERSSLTIDDVELSFAITCHRSQGSEWLEVIWFLDKDANVNTGFLNRNLIYTGLSRGRRKVKVIGCVMNSSLAVANSLPYRCEAMTDRVRNLLPRLYQEFKEDLLVADVYRPPDQDDYPTDDDFEDFY